MDRKLVSLSKPVLERYKREERGSQSALVDALLADYYGITLSGTGKHAELRIQYQGLIEAKRASVAPAPITEKDIPVEADHAPAELVVNRFDDHFKPESPAPVDETPTVAPLENNVCPTCGRTMLLPTCLNCEL